MPQQSLHELGARLADADLRDPDAQVRLQGLIAEARQSCAHLESLVGCLDAAAVLVRSTDKLAPRELEEVRAMACRLIGIVSVQEDAHQERCLETREAAAQVEESSSALKTLNSMALGGIMVELGIITEGQIGTALERSAAHGTSFGQTLVSMGLATEGDVQQALALQRALVTKPSDAEGAASDTPAPPTTGAAVQGILLGEVLVKMGKIGRTELDIALGTQERTGKRIGEALIAVGVIGPADIQEALDVQAKGAGH